MQAAFCDLRETSAFGIYPLLNFAHRCLLLQLIFIPQIFKTALDTARCRYGISSAATLSVLRSVSNRKSMK